ncbi:aspartate aminotransferase family protein [Sphingopyxis sp.]|jgi:glutamate-1-semialdehyde 2,1-aminomutase|uniref:aspartate aminotransferase family protein n=1 Tax=Sphingopyxis sp. TaxID=1908224 RepID=UPI002DF0E865|nr:aspartate aminotransferase family protein [Sphingopyxis sp.]
MAFPESSVQSEKLWRRAARVMPAGLTRSTLARKPFTIYAQSGQGAYITDVDGVTRIDMTNNYWSLIHGHAHPKIGEAVIDQVARGTAFAMPTEADVMFAEYLVDRIPSVEKIRFGNSGSEAVMTAIKVARALTGRSRIAKIEGFYHGSYDYAEVSLSAGPGNWGRGDHPTSSLYAPGAPQSMAEDVVVLPFNDVEASRAILEAETQKGGLAGILVDPVSHSSGLVPCSDEFLKMLRDYCDRTGSVLIFDEVFSFRCSYRGAQELTAVKPDLTALGKVIGGGLPVGAVGGTAAAMAVLEEEGNAPRLSHGGTFSANPVTMAAGLTAMTLFTAEEVERLNMLCQTVCDQLRAGLATLGNLGVRASVRQSASFFAVYLTEEAPDTYRALAEHKAKVPGLYDRLEHELVNHGILGNGRSIFSLSTPMTDDDVPTIVNGICASVEAVARQGGFA